MSREKSTKASEAGAGRAWRGRRGCGFVGEGADEGDEAAGRGRRGDVAAAGDAAGATPEVGAGIAKASVATSRAMAKKSLGLVASAEASGVCISGATCPCTAL